MGYSFCKLFVKQQRFSVFFFSRTIFVGRVSKIATKQIKKGSAKEKIASLQLNVEDDEGKVVRIATSTEEAFSKYKDFFKVILRMRFFAMPFRL